MSDFKPPVELIKKERSAEEARARLAGLEGEAYEKQWRTWRTAAEDFQAAVTEYAARNDVTMARNDLEQAVKAAVRHAEEDPAE
ncbi:hypothetical protein [Streptomyces lasiicapitis]|uniref:Uncharacterized protein n=1 Tax=Streptomyces lasiicapitis TaxID=1923961 RepID=A0ABQ2MUE4_9ACTN|nr:hypothetical protein [Streptomyces lasiicapitis]GGO58832.1 hypothetical protein GCM10012286_79030 [Streptomyces lasiicapitis]